jgi:hypothetical protein
MAVKVVQMLTFSYRPFTTKPTCLMVSRVVAYVVYEPEV